MRFKIVVEQHPDTFVAYPLSLRGVVGQGETFEDALADARSALQFHLETFGADGPETESPVLEASIVEITITA